MKEKIIFSLFIFLNFYMCMNECVTKIKKNILEKYRTLNCFIVALLYDIIGLSGLKVLKIANFNLKKSASYCTLRNFI